MAIYELNQQELKRVSGGNSQLRENPENTHGNSFIGSIRIPIVHPLDLVSKLKKQLQIISQQKF